MKVALVLLAVFALASDLDADIESLSSGGQDARAQAATRLIAKGKLPKAAAKPALKYYADEMRRALSPRPKEKSRPLKSIPLIGDEASVVKMKVEPQQFTDRDFLLCGALKASDTYTGSYGGCDDEYYAFEFYALTSKAKFAPGDHLYIYANRKLFKSVADAATGNEEGGANGLVLRVLVKNRHRSQLDSNWNVLEMIDWQYMTDDAKGWKPWTLGSTRLSKDLIGKLPPEAGGAILDFILDNQSDDIDKTISVNLQSDLMAMDKKTKASAYQQARKRIQKFKKGPERDRVQALADQLRPG